MKNLKLNLKGLYGYRQSLLSRSPQPRDNREMSERRPSEERTLLAPLPQRFARYAAMLIMLLTLGVGQMWADGTYTVVGMAAPNANDYDVQVTVQVCGDCNSGGAKWFDDWSIKDNNAGITFEGKKLYIASWTDYYNGTNAMYFKEKDGSTQKNYNKVHDSWWGADGYNHKIYQYNESGTSGSWYGVKTMTKGARVYFDASTWDETSIKLVTGHANHQKYDGMSAISNTKLYYGTSSATTWSDAMGWGIVGNTTAETGDNWLTNVSNKASEYTGWKNWSLENAGDNNAYLCVPNGDAGEEPSMSYYATHYNSGALNNTQTIKYAVGINGATPTELTSGYVPADIAISSYKFSSKKYDAVDASSGSVTLSKNGSNYSATVTAARTATTTYTVSNVHEDYSFLGWYSAASGGTLLSSDASYTFYPTSATTAYARFSKENNHTVTISRYCTSTSSEISSTTAKVGEVTYSEISVPVIAGYSFVNWTVGSGLTVKSGDNTNSNPIHVITKASGDYTLTANYTEVLTTDWKLIGDNTTGSPFGDNYTYASGKAMSKKSGHSTENNAYKTLDVTKLPADYYGFKVATASGNSNEYGYGSTEGYYITFNRSASSTQKQVYNGDQHELKFIPDALGEYEFRVEYPENKYVYVTFPTAYAVNFSKGSVDGSNSDVSATYSSVAFSSGTKVQSGKSVTLTAPAAKGGYTYRGWYSVNAADPSDYSSNRYTDQATYSPTVSAAVTAYACYTEDSYTVTVNASSGGQVSYNGGVAGSSCSASAGVATKSQTISAIPNAGYAFVGWTNVDAGHHITDYTATWNNTNKGWDLTVNADAATTITANFAPRFALVGAIVADGNPTGGMPGWENENQVAFAYSDGTYTLSRSLTSPNTSYAFKIIDRLAETWIWRGHSSSTNNLAVDNTTTYTLTEKGGNNVFFDSRGVGSYMFTVVEETITGVVYPKVKIKDGANSHVVTWGYVSDNGQEGGTITSVVDGEATPNSIASGKYVKDGGSITATAEEKSGYRFIDFRTSSTYGGGSQLGTSKTYTVASVKADQNIYAQFAENLCTVTITANDKTKGSIIVGDEDFAWDGTVNVGVYNYKSLAVTPVAGYYFAGWTLSTSPDFSVDDAGESGASTNLRGIGGTHGSTGTLTANFQPLDKIYFRNIFDDGENEPTRWANVYVYFDVDWDTYNNPSWGVWYATGKVCTQMTQIEETDVYWAYVPRAFTSGNLTHVAFSEQAFTANLNFRTGNAAFRSDYNKLLNMFVPHHTKSSTQTYTSGSSYTTNYYSNGYWMKYDTRAGQGAGYYLKKYDGRNSYSLDSVFRATNDDATFIQCRIRVDGTEDSNNKYMIVSAAGLNYITDSTITSLRNTKGVSEDTRTLADNDVYFQVKATSEGLYTFILDQSGDKMKLTVDYPVSPGDYRLKHTYVGRNKANSADSTYITYSDIIKASDAASGATVSMYLSTAGTETLVLQECTSINGTTKLPEWNAGESDGLSGVFTKVETDGDGVYQFDVTVNTSTNKVTTTENIALYDGPFYIKTDCAPGGWANFTANIMDKNTANPTAFDYYFMKWIDLDTDKNEKKNIKCVIANKYNNAVSDTLKSDGIATMDGTEPVLDNDGSVRFSYNTKTNTLKRAYLTGAAKLTLETYEAKKIYWPSTSSDQYGSHPGFVDDVVWTYELTVDAKLGAKAGVKAAWTNKAGNDKEEMLIANTNPIISGTGSGTYRMRLVFDFKTNSLISSWTPSGEITDALSDVDVMLVREGQDPSNVITFGTGGSLKPRKLVGSLKFTKTNYEGKVSAWNSTTRPLLTFFVSFPFDVKVSDVFGLNSAYGDAYVIRRYAGDERAAKGFFRGDGTTSFWKDLTTEDTMNAYEGYIVVLDNDYFNSDAYSLWGGKSELYLYFPSSKGGIISEGSKTIPVPVHECRIDRTFDNGSGRTLNHMNTDSHWNLIGVPVFTTYDDGGDPEAGTPGAIFADTEDEANASFNYFYEWNSTGNDFAISSAKDYEFKAMHGYMVQYHGDVTFTGSVFTPASVAARRTVEKKNYDIELQVLNNEAEMLNHTYVALRDGASSEFVLNEDVYLSPNNRDAEIYTFAGEYDVAANRLPVENQLVQMGLNVHKAGNYTISMPSTFSGTATLVDTYTNTRTNLAIDEYEVNLPKGTCDDRFLLELNIHKVPTAIDGVDGGSLKDGNAHKFIMNDRMYILKNGVIYDACGNRVQ